MGMSQMLTPQKMANFRMNSNQNMKPTSSEDPRYIRGGYTPHPRNGTLRKSSAEQARLFCRDVVTSPEGNVQEDVFKDALGIFFGGESEWYAKMMLGF